MGFTADQIDEKAESKKEVVENIKESVGNAVKPDEALKEMSQSDEGRYKGEIGFTASEVQHYVESEIKESVEDYSGEWYDAEDVGEEDAVSDAEKAAAQTMQYISGETEGMDNEKWTPRNKISEYVAESLANSDNVMEMVDDGERIFVDQEAYQSRNEESNEEGGKGVFSQVIDYVT